MHVDDDAQAGVGQQRHDAIGPGQVGPDGGGVVGVGAARQLGEGRPRLVGGAVVGVVDVGVGRPGLQPLPDDPQPHDVEPQLGQGAGVGGGEAPAGVGGVGREHVGQPRPLGGPDARGAGDGHVHRPPTALGHEVGPVELEVAAELVGEVRAAEGLDGPGAGPSVGGGGGVRGGCECGGGGGVRGGGGRECRGRDQGGDEAGEVSAAQSGATLPEGPDPQSHWHGRWVSRRWVRGRPEAAVSRGFAGEGWASGCPGCPSKLPTCSVRKT